MPPYPHKPDTAFFVRERAHADRSIGLGARTVAQGRAHEGVVNSVIGTCLEAAASAWLLDEHQVTIDAYVRQAADFAAQGLELLPGPHRWGTLVDWLQAALLAEDQPLVQRLARPALDGEQLEPDTGIYPAEPLLPLAAALAVDDPGSGSGRPAELAAEVRRRAELPTTSAEELRRVDALPDIAEALLAHDQQALDQACAGRSARNARHWGRSVENRRHWHGLLDPMAALLTASAPRYGLLVPDVPDLPRGILPGPHRTSPA